MLASQNVLHAYRKLCVAFLLGLFAAAVADPGCAQENTTATYEDWVLRCANNAGPPPQKICDMEQMTQVQGNNTPLSRVAIARPAKGQPLKFIVQLPVNISIASGIKLYIDDKDAGISSPFTRCVPAGCFATVDVKDDVVTKIRAASGRGKIVFKNATDQEVILPLSFKGFGHALDALING